jgi:hypothetical protein
MINITDGSARSLAFIRLGDAIQTIVEDCIMAGSLMIAEGVPEDKVKEFASVVAHLIDANNGLLDFLGIPDDFEEVMGS